ncbi:Glyceraldehyde-3-phosphate dehydrogenase [Tupaia chinensis]|uniref:Glyceraldehyde-3-phosphate dehydrogenase n=1 Tax=Tupaia chinensis TaxID=246437 RepID=L9JCX5_TUPCH|nr:Glyceraldehyde-3-phosphate dehydrogenase [Tupaia chinensis]
MATSATEERQLWGTSGPMGGVGQQHGALEPSRPAAARCCPVPQGDKQHFSCGRVSGGNEQEMETGTQFLELGQAKGMAWKITFHLPSEAINHERKFPKHETSVPSVQCQLRLGDRMVRVGEDRLGCIGCLVTRAAFNSGKVEAVALRDHFTHFNYMSHVFQYDSTHGQLNSTVKAGDRKHVITTWQARGPANISGYC